MRIRKYGSQGGSYHKSPSGSRDIFSVNLLSIPCPYQRALNYPLFSSPHIARARIPLWNLMKFVFYKECPFLNFTAPRKFQTLVVIDVWIFSNTISHTNEDDLKYLSTVSLHSIILVKVLISSLIITSTIQVHRHFKYVLMLGVFSVLTIVSVAVTLKMHLEESICSVHQHLLWNIKSRFNHSTNKFEVEIKASKKYDE